MADTVDKATRSRMMSGIRGRDTKPELVLRRALHRLGFRYSLHSAGLPGRPDLVLSKYKAVIFVHGCFWHRHDNCRFATTPASNAAFWLSKFKATIERDIRTLARLEDLGWRIAVVWECRLSGEHLARNVSRLVKWLKAGRPRMEIS